MKTNKNCIESFIYIKFVSIVNETTTFNKDDIYASLNFSIWEISKIFIYIPLMMLRCWLQIIIKIVMRRTSYPSIYPIIEFINQEMEERNNTNNKS